MHFIKQPRTPEERCKALLDLQGHKERYKEYIMHTFKNSKAYRNIRLMMLITESLTYHKIWVKGVTQAYIQGCELERDVYIKPDTQFQLPSDTYLKLLKPLYGLSESGDSRILKHNTVLKKDL